MRPSPAPGAPRPPEAPKPKGAARLEELHYDLFLEGRPAGTARWSASVERGQLVIRRETQFGGGSWAGVRKLEVSRLEPGTGLPTHYSETTEGPGRGHLEAVFDRRAGLVTLRQGRDEASVALVQDLHDPVSLIQRLRFLPDSVTSLRVPMVGGTALVTRLPDQSLETPWGERPVRVYYLRPGVAVVYVEADEPHRPLRLSQRLGAEVLEASLARAASPRPTPPAPAPARTGGRPQPGREARPVERRPAEAGENRPAGPSEGRDGGRRRRRRAPRRGPGPDGG